MKWHSTLQKKKVCAQQKCPNKHFKICYVYEKRKSFFIWSNFYFSPYECPALCKVKGKSKVAQNEKRKKLHGFSFFINIANFEVFGWTFSLRANLFFLKSD